MCPNVSPLRTQANKLLEESAILTAKGDHNAGLEKAMEARKRERSLTKYREANGLGDQVNIDLTYATEFNLAVRLGLLNVLIQSNRRLCVYDRARV